MKASGFRHLYPINRIVYEPGALFKFLKLQEIGMTDDITNFQLEVLYIKAPMIKRSGCSIRSQELGRHRISYTCDVYDAAHSFKQRYETNRAFDLVYIE